jgi:tetratricopeptide (TPR) repeat protein
MKSGLRVALVVALCAVPSLALAQGKDKGAAKTDAKADTAASSGKGVKRDPNGVKGISPFWESLKKGDDLYVARDFDGAIGAYRDAITKEPQNPMGHYRIGEAHLAKNDTQEAESAWVAALRYVGQDAVLKAKILFVLADLRERQKSYDDATDRWNAYAQFAQQQPSAKAYPNTATDRKQRIETWKKLLVDYGEVKKRIEARLKEADEKARKDAEKSTKEK